MPSPVGLMPANQWQSMCLPDLRSSPACSASHIASRAPKITNAMKIANTIIESTQHPNYWLGSTRELPTQAQGSGTARPFPPWRLRGGPMRSATGSNAYSKSGSGDLWMQVF